MVSPKTPKKTAQKPQTIPETANAFLKELSAKFPDFNFIKSTRFKYRAPNSIFIDQNCPYPLPIFALLTLHELGHALSKHKDYNTDIERLKIELEAWQRAKTEIKNHPNWTKKYGITYDEDFAEAELDSYRDWLHQKSKCKTCGLTMYQTQDKKYHCPNCEL